MKAKDLIDLFQCPGCLCGINPWDCEHYKPQDFHNHVCCLGHTIGTMVIPIGYIAIGLPKGFNRPGCWDRDGKDHPYMNIRIWPKGKKPNWDDFNVPVWALEKEGFLFVLTFSPRINETYVDIIEGGDLGLVPQAIDVSKFYEEMD